MQKKDLEKQYNMRISPNEYEEIKSLGHNHLKVKLDEIWKNRIEPSELYKMELYKIHKEIVNSKVLSYNKKEKALNVLFAYEPWSWRVVGISKNAIQHFKNNRFRYLKGTQRDHYFQNRNVTMGRMIDSLMPFEKWWQWYWENDRTIIVTKKEHSQKSYNFNNDIIKVDPKLGYFPSDKTVNFSFAYKFEGKFLEKLSESFNI